MLCLQLCSSKKPLNKYRFINLFLNFTLNFCKYTKEHLSCYFLNFFTSSSVRSCEARSWSLWLTLSPSPSSWVCWLSTPPTALRASRTCPMRPSQTTHDRCSGSRPPSSPGQRCWSWSGCWVSRLHTHTHTQSVMSVIWTAYNTSGFVWNSAQLQPIKMLIDVR